VQLILKQTSLHAVIAIGCVIKGETTHDEHINRAVSSALMDLSLKFNKPVGFGLLTVNDLSQAEARAGGSVGNKGEETAMAVLAMLQLAKSL
jgi:6,7-dimethyl-8-ribityllumazine synthase